jgi:aspartyl/asparaginyl beta-hydroxylase (cupin superfamily)
MELEMKTLALAAVVLAATASVVRAENVCPSEIDKTVSDWKAIHLVPASKPAAISKGEGMHAHVQQAVDSMRYHLKMAKELCREGKDHESLLHLDVIRAFLNLPEIQHPADHRYLYKDQRT